MVQFYYNYVPSQSSHNLLNSYNRVVFLIFCQWFGVTEVNATICWVNMDLLEGTRDSC